MSRIAWPLLMELGMRRLGLAPDVFWELTPAELMFLAGAEDGQAALGRSGLADLMAQYPDSPKDGESDGGSE